jgi:RNA polymerase sigma-70 factor, ECF subfamily
MSVLDSLSLDTQLICEEVMSATSSHKVTTLLRAWNGGDQAARDELAELVYQELHQMAKRYMRRENPGHTLQTTTLVNEAWMRLINARTVDWQDRAHFFAVASLAMRRILVDYARRRPHLAGGNKPQHVALEEAVELSQEYEQELAALDDALTELEKLDPRKCRVVELKFLVGLSVNEISQLLGVGIHTVLRDWKAAKVILYQLMSEKSKQ